MGGVPYPELGVWCVPHCPTPGVTPGYPPWDCGLLIRGLGLCGMDVLGPKDGEGRKNQTKKQYLSCHNFERTEAAVFLIVMS